MYSNYLHTLIHDATTHDISSRLYFLGVDQHSYDHFKGTMTSWPPGITKTAVRNFKSFYFPGKIKDLQKWYSMQLATKPCIKSFVTVAVASWSCSYIYYTVAM